MINSFKHKGLEKFFLTGSKAGINPAHASRLRQQLTTLELSRTVSDMDLPGWFLHPLHGGLEGHWSVRVNANWRITFRYDERGAEVVDYQDYHS